MKIEFGVPVHVGNYVIKKYNRTLGRKELAELRRISGIPENVAKSLERGRLPFIKVSTASGSWGVEFVIGTSMNEARTCPASWAIVPGVISPLERNTTSEP